VLMWWMGEISGPRNQSKGMVLEDDLPK